MGVFAHQHQGEEWGRWGSAWSCLFCVCVWLMQAQAGDRVPAVGEQGVLWEQLGPEGGCARCAGEIGTAPAAFPCRGPCAIDCSSG